MVVRKVEEIIPQIKPDEAKLYCRTMKSPNFDLFFVQEAGAQRRLARSALKMAAVAEDTDNWRAYSALVRKKRGSEAARARREIAAVERLSVNFHRNCIHASVFSL